MGFDINVSRFEGGVAAAIDQPTLQAFLARAGGHRSATRPSRAVA